MSKNNVQLNTISYPLIGGGNLAPAESAVVSMQKEGYFK
jgi:hypothetical protein